MVVRYGRWYLLCHSHHADALRTFRIDRITEVELLDGTFEVPADLDPAAELEANLGKGWEHETHVVFDAPLERGAALDPAHAGRPARAARRRLRAGRQHQQRRRRTPASGWPACRSRSRWSGGDGRGAGRGGRGLGERARPDRRQPLSELTATSLPRVQPSEIGR